MMFTPDIMKKSVDNVIHKTMLFSAMMSEKLLRMWEVSQRQIQMQYSLICFGRL